MNSISMLLSLHKQKLKGQDVLTHLGLAMPYGDTDMGQHCLR